MKTASTRRRKPLPSVRVADPVPVDWTPAVLHLVPVSLSWNTTPLDMAAAYAAARMLVPSLTVGQFHDGLRALRDQGRIRLVPWTRAYATLPDMRLPMFLDGEVMWWIEAP